MATHYRAELMGVCTEELSQEFHGSLISIPAFAVYFTAKYLFIRKPVSGNAQIILRFAGSNVFGIYLSEGLLRKLTRPVYNFNCKYIGSLPACILWVLAVFICGCFLTALLKKIPFVKRFL